MKIDEAVFERAFGPDPVEDEHASALWRHLHASVEAYLRRLPSAEPGRDRIAVVVNGRGEFSCWNVDEEDVDNPEMWESLEEDANRRADAHPPFARAIVRCNLPRPAEPVEVEGSVEEVDHD